VVTGDDQLTEFMLSACVGFLVGLAYFGGLWWTARRAGKVKAPGVLLAASFLVRMALLISVIYAVTRGAPLGVASALVGLWLARKTAFAYAQRGAGRP